MERTRVLGWAVSGQVINEVADRCDVQGGVKTRYGGAPGGSRQ